MALRLIQVDVSGDFEDVASQVLEEAHAAEVWSAPGGSKGVLVFAVMGAERTGAAMDLLHERISEHGDLRALVLPLDAVMPRPAASLDTSDRKERVTAEAVSREEVYANIAGNAQLSPTFLAMVVLATVVAAIGLASDNTAAVIGAMVVAPLLGPNMALALGLTLGDRPLIERAGKSAAVGFILCLASASVIAFALEIDPAVRELASRTTPGVRDVVLAVAAGAAGTLAYTTGAPTYLVGVMVAVALLPPTVAAGLLFGHGMFAEAVGALLLAAINSAALVLASMLTFLASGMRPRAWWKEGRARRSVRRGALVLVLLLLALGGLIYLSSVMLGPGGPG